MKTLSNGTNILDRMYYYLLEFHNFEKECLQKTFIQKNYQKDSLKDLTKEEFTEYFQYASYEDAKNI